MALPELCSKCRKLKSPDLGKFVKVPGRLHDRRWICDHCLDKPVAKRCGRSRPSPIELESRRAILDSGYKFVEEYPIGKFRYDFALPALRLILEIDSKKWHDHPSRKAKDRRKTKRAEADGWEVARVTTKRAESVGFLVNQTIMRREAELAVFPDY